MLRNKKTKIAVLLYVALLFIILSLQAAGIISPDVFGFKPSPSSAAIPLAPSWVRLTYHHLHANLLHLCLNAWCFLSCVFLLNVSARKILAAFLIAATVPESIAFGLSAAELGGCTSTPPIIGLSGVCFALMGFIQWRVPRKLYYNTVVALSIFLPWLLSANFANALHLYCYLVGIISQLIYNYIKCK